MEEKNLYFWGNIEVQILKRYPVFNKVKIYEVSSERIHIVDLAALRKNREKAINISLEWLED